MNLLSFQYNSDMQNDTISDKEGNPYLFHLKEGKNTIKLEVVVGEVGGIITEVEESMYWHTTSHIMAQAVKRLFPDAKLAIGPSIENGFYYDYDII